LTAQKNAYNANQVEIQVKAAEAWIKFKEGKVQDALDLMKAAVDLESKTQKHPVTPGELIPATEQLGDLLMEMKKPDQALEAYELDLKDHPNRFNGLYGAGQAAAMSGKKESARHYYEQLLTSANGPNLPRPELKVARTYLK
jgi:tetratricopeptide (TPR) repeat protein